MSEKTLPVGWVWTTLGEIRIGEHRTITPAKTPEQMFELYSVPSFETREPEIVLGKDIGSSKQIVAESTVLICKINPRINRAWVVGNYSQFPKLASTEWIAFGKVDGIASHYLCYFMQTSAFRDFLAMNVSGVGGSLMRARTSALDDYLFPLPPLAEQQRIVAEIEKQLTRLDAGVAALRDAQAKLRRYKAAVLKAVCEGRLVLQDPADEPASVLLRRILAERRQKWEAGQAARGKDPRTLHYEEPAPPDTSELPELPEGWVWGSAEQLCDFITKGTTPKADKLYSGEGEIPFIKVYNLTFGGYLDFGIDPTFVSQETHSRELARSLVLPGDVLMNIVGPPLGKVSIVPDLYPEWNMNQAIARFRCVPGYDRKFLSCCLRSESILDWAKRRAKATAGQFNLTLEICRDLPLPVPSLAEQQRIVAEVERRLSVVEELEAAVGANLARAGRLRQSILKRAFEGKLVPQDPADEPAGVLLERIRAQRAGRGVEGKRQPATVQAQPRLPHL